MKIIAAAKRNPVEVVVAGTIQPITQNAVLLGLRLSNFGFRQQITHNRNKASRQLQKLKRFTQLPARIKLRLYKSLILPILEYPPVPLHAASKSAILTLQIIQNRALRWVNSQDIIDERPTVERLHRVYKMVSVNQRLYTLARRLWERLEEDQDPNLAPIRAIEDALQDGGGRRGQREHRWWPRSRQRALGPIPPPFLVQRDVQRLIQQGL